MNAPTTENEVVVMVVVILVMPLLPWVMEMVMVRWERRAARVMENRSNN